MIEASMQFNSCQTNVVTVRYREQIWE